MQHQARRFTRQRLAVTLAALSTAGLGGTPVLAQTSQPSFAIEEVVVTARRRSESLQEVPVSVTTFSATDIEDMGVTDITHISEMTTNLVIQPNAGGNDGTMVCMRGLCRTDFTITEDPMVGVYLDGVYISKSIGSLFDSAELERVEVLRGPQGTLYGKNTLGGAIIFHTRKPSGELGGHATFTAGNYDRTDGKAYLEFPVSDNLAGAVSLMSKRRDPFVDNTLGKDIWDEDNQAATVALRWTPGDDLTVDYAFDWQKKRERPMVPQLSSATGILLGPPNAANVRPDREDKVTVFGDAVNNTDIRGHALTVNYDIGDTGFSVKSITGYRDVENLLIANATGADNNLLYNNPDDFEFDAFSQEFQLTGSLADGFVDFVAGLFYFNEEGLYIQHQDFGVFGLFQEFKTEIDNTSMAVFGEATFHLTDRFDASIGLRYTDEERKQDHWVTELGSGFTYLNTREQTYNGAPFPLPNEIQEDNVAPRVSLTYQWNDDLMTFLTYARGFKSGGFNHRSFSPLQWGPYDYMTVDSYEIGMKSDWLDNRVRVNLGIFYEELDDMQSQVNAVDPAAGGFSTVIQNAAKATVEGFEAEVILRLVEGLTISAGYGYVDAEYDEFLSFDNNSGAIVNIADDRTFEATPEHSYNLSLNYTFPQFTSVGELRARVDWSGQSETAFTPKISGNDDLLQDRYDILNARITFDEIAAGNGSLGFSLWARNLADEEYKIGGYEVNIGQPLGRVGISQWGEPRTYGLDVTYRFGSMN
ncbi:MAG: TonB-dependent receptor [Halioglobus sp.]|nr:TonB-dependent receptor [Halioglobus sp.]